MSEAKPKKKRKHDPRYPDRTRNERTRQREADYKAMAQKFGYPNKSALLTALLNGDATVIKVEKPQDLTKTR